MKPLPCSAGHDGCCIFYELGRTGANQADLTTKQEKEWNREPFWRELELGPVHPGIDRKSQPS